MSLLFQKPVNGVAAKYKDQGNHNPYEDALNFRDEQELIELFFRIPEIPANLQEKSSLERFKLINQLEMFRVPFLSIQNLAYEIYAMISAGYQNRCTDLDWYKKENTSQDRAAKLSRQCSAGTLLLLGISGIGKSTAVEEILADLNQVIIHERYEDHLFIRTQIVYLMVDCPAKATLGGFLRQIFLAFDQALGNTNYFQQSKRKTIDTMLSEVVGLIEEYHVGIIAIDEINHLVNNKNEVKELSNMMTTLTNLVSTPFIFIGTYLAQHLLNQNLRTTRRMMKNGYFDWNRLEEDSQEWNFFVHELWQLQYTLSFTEITDELAHALYEASQGILAIAVAVFAQVQRKVIMDELNPEEKISVTDIEETLKKDFVLLEPFLKSIRTNNIKEMIGYEDIFNRINEINDENTELLEIQEIQKESYLKEIQKVRKKKVSRKKTYFDNIKKMDMLIYLGDEELKQTIDEFLKDKSMSGLSDQDLSKQLVKQVLDLEKLKEESYQEELKKELPTQENSDDSLTLILKQDNPVEYEDYLQNNMIGEPDDF